MSSEERTALESGMNEADGCEEECWWGRLRVAAQLGFDGGSFFLKECRVVFSYAVVPVPEGWHCPHLQRLSHWHQSER